MEYNQETIDRIRKVVPANFIRELHQRVNQNSTESSFIPYTTVVDALRVYRMQGKPYYKNRKLKIYNLAIDMLRERGIDIDIKKRGANESTPPLNKSNEATN